MKYLFPHPFKKIGAIIAPVGFAIWICMQFGYVTRVLTFLFGESNTSYHIANVCIAIISFLSFLAGIYFVTFSREKIEDEMVQRTRLDSFQFAALAQIIFIITGFLFIIFFKEPGEGGLMLFFITIIFLFWFCFICRFNYIMHIKINRLNKA
jgi:hypothetical protein